MKYLAFPKLLFLLLLSSCTNCEYQMKSYIEPMSIHGSVIKKYIDKDNHLYPYIVISDNGEQKTILPAEKYNGTELYDWVQINDSIIKVPGTRYFEVKRDTISKIFELKCKEFNR